MIKKEQDNWINNRWRPMMGWMYFVVCITDFVMFPIMWSILQAIQGGSVTQQWDPITLSGAGLFHVAMGAVLGITAWSRGQEKMAGVAHTSYTHQTMYDYEDPYISSMRPMRQTKYQTTTRVVTGYGGRKAPPEEYQPEI